MGLHTFCGGSMTVQHNLDLCPSLLLSIRKIKVHIQSVMLLIHLLIHLSAIKSKTKGGPCPCFPWLNMESLEPFSFLPGEFTEMSTERGVLG